MLQIGEFSQLSELSIRMLRHYDEIGLLAPAAVDASSGYRHYEPSQLRIAHRITALKRLGLTLEQVGQLLDEELTTEELRGMLRMESTRAHRERDDAQDRLDELERHLAMVRLEGELDPVDLVERSVPRLPFLATRVVAPDLTRLIAIVTDVVAVGRSRESMDH